MGVGAAAATAAGAASRAVVLTPRPDVPAGADVAVGPAVGPASVLWPVGVGVAVGALTHCPAAFRTVPGGHGVARRGDALARGRVPHLSGRTSAGDLEARLEPVVREIRFAAAVSGVEREDRGVGAGREVQGACLEVLRLAGRHLAESVLDRLA